MTSTFKQDSELIDRILVIHAGLSGDEKLIKQAGIIDTLGGLANTIKGLVASRIEQEGVAGTLSTYLLTTYLFRVYPLLGLAVSAASQFGYSPGAIFKWAYDAAMQTIEEKGTFTDDDAKTIAEQATSQLAVAASLEPLHELNRQGKLVSVMKGEFEDKTDINKHAAPRGLGKGGGYFQMFNIFRYFRGTKTAAALAGGMLKWVIWAVLSGLALVEGPALLANLFGLGKGPEATDSTSPTSTSPTSTSPQETQEQAHYVQAPDFLNRWLGGGKSQPAQTQTSTINFPKQNHNLAASGAGESYFLNTDKNQWWVQISGDIRNMMIQWAMKIYPELKGYESEIRASKSFDRVASILSREYNPNKSGNWLKIPPSNLHTWRDIVDTFAGEAAMRIKQKTQQESTEVK